VRRAALLPDMSASGTSRHCTPGRVKVRGKLTLPFGQERDYHLIRRSAVQRSSTCAKGTGQKSADTIWQSADKVNAREKRDGNTVRLNNGDPRTSGTPARGTATDPGSVPDFQGWVRTAKHALLKEQRTEKDETGKELYVHLLERT